MRAINYLIVEVKDEYENERGNLISNQDVDDASFIARRATVLAAPDYTIVKAGDEVICHHNVFRIKGTVGGVQVRSDYHIEGKKYYVPLTSVFMYKRDGEFNAISPFCFVKPIPEEKEESMFIMSDSEHNKNTHKGYKNLRGVMKYPCKEVEAYKDQEVIFSKYSEYEFIIDGEVLYKMSTKDILAQL